MRKLRAGADGPGDSRDKIPPDKNAQAARSKLAAEAADLHAKRAPRVQTQNTAQSLPQVTITDKPRVRGFDKQARQTIAQEGTPKRDVAKETPAATTPKQAREYRVRATPPPPAAQQGSKGPTKGK